MSKLMALLGVFTLGALLVGFTVWVMVLAGQPVQPEPNEDIKPPENNTPFVGKQW